MSSDFGYKNDLPPDLNSPTKLKALAKSRDATKFATFKHRILSYVRAHHGDTPWAGE